MSVETELAEIKGELRGLGMFIMFLRELATALQEQDAVMVELATQPLATAEPPASAT